jgi:hypothetical protein
VAVSGGDQPYIAATVMNNAGRASTRRATRSANGAPFETRAAPAPHGEARHPGFPGFPPASAGVNPGYDSSKGWREKPERKVEWFSPKAAAKMVHEPALRDIIRQLRKKTRVNAPLDPRIHLSAKKKINRRVKAGDDDR